MPNNQGKRRLYFALEISTFMSKKSLFLATVFLFPLAAIAASVHIGSDYFLKGGEKTTEDLYTFGESAMLAGAVSGDAVAIGERVTAAGDISADALLFGREVTLSGNVKDDARLLGAEIAVSGTIGDDLVAIGPRVALFPAASVGGNLYVVGDRAALAGTVTGSVRSFARETRVAGEVGGALETWGIVSFGDGARIGGDFIYHAPKEIAIPAGVVGGEAVFVAERDGAALSGLSGLFSGLLSLQILATLMFGFALLLFCRERTEEVLLDAELRFWPRVLRGLIIALLVPLAAFSLSASVVGLLLGIALAALFLAALIFSFVFAALLVGSALERFCFKRSPYPLSWRPVLLGTLVLALVSVLPYVGLFVPALLLFAALGGVGTAFYKYLREIR